MRHLFAAGALLLATGSVCGQSQPPMFATTKVEGTDNACCEKRLAAPGPPRAECRSPGSERTI